jgi:hypothetical protein
MKNAIFWDVIPVALVRKDISEECITSISVERISKLGTIIAVTSN